MPYVSPRGNVKAGSPAQIAESFQAYKQRRNAAYAAASSHTPSKELGEILYGRDADPEIVQLMNTLENWSPWDKPVEDPSIDRLAQFDPLDASPEAQVVIPPRERQRFPQSKRHDAGRPQYLRVDSGYSDTQSNRRAAIDASW